MEFKESLALLREVSVFESALLMAGADSPQQVQRQLSDWTRAGKLVQLRRGLYALPEPYQPARPHEFAIANALRPASYVSLQSALAYYGLIPEHVPVTTSVTTGRPGRGDNAFGRFLYRHVAPERFFGFRYHQVAVGEWAFLAAPEKALLDLVYLTPGGDAEGFLRELRLQNLDGLDPGALEALAARFERPKLGRAAEVIGRLIAEEREGYRTL